ncbi:MAG: hypothetical protein COZ49_00415 [Candidatus Yonathbacteria bacterium CG_4_10_14_3_um_filter_47_65]|nr:MAG: hypothetical protein COZ49_00415 [Candidatus Yonathbacteria bacterium CG_4_10_14_3_um_filter_47_65]
MREPFLRETPAAFRKIPNRSGGAGRKGVEGEGNSRPALAFRKNFAAFFENFKSFNELIITHFRKFFNKNFLI